MCHSTILCLAMLNLASGSARDVVRRFHNERTLPSLPTSLLIVEPEWRRPVGDEEPSRSYLRTESSLVGKGPLELARVLRNRPPALSCGALGGFTRRRTRSVVRNSPTPRNGPADLSQALSGRLAQGIGQVLKAYRPVGRRQHPKRSAFQRPQSGVRLGESDSAVALK